MEHKIVKKSTVFPPPEEFERAVKRITRSERRTNIGLASNASDEEKAKYKFCKTIGCYTIENDISELDLAKKLGISHSRVEKVLFCHIDELDLKELVNYVAKLAMPWEVKVNSEYAGEKSSPKTH